jgi:hypothetical protein
VSYTAPELLCRGGLLDLLVGVWSCGCVLDELAHQRVTFRGESDSAALANLLLGKSSSTHTPPHAPLTTRHLYSNAAKYLLGFEQRGIAVKGAFDAVPREAVAASAHANLRAVLLVRGLLQVTPAARATTCRAAMGRPFFATSLTHIVSEVVGGKTRYVVACRASWNRSSCSGCMRIHIG